MPATSLLTFFAFLVDLQKYFDIGISLTIAYLPKLLLAILVLLGGLYIINRLSGLFKRTMEVREVDVSLRSFLSSLVSIGLKVLLLFSVADMIGIQTTSFLAILGAAGLAVGLALQGSLSNFAGGVLILIIHPYRVGDQITTQGQTGKVKEIQIFNTILLTDDGKTVILPNGAVSNGTIVNHTTSGMVIFSIPLEISAALSFEEVQKSLTSIVQMDTRVSNPAVRLTKITPTIMTLSITGTTSPEHSGDVQNTILQHIKSWINEKKIV